jgi:hypothetical protein
MTAVTRAPFAEDKPKAAAVSSSMLCTFTPSQPRLGTGMFCSCSLALGAGAPASARAAEFSTSEVAESNPAAKSMAVVPERGEIRLRITNLHVSELYVLEIVKYRVAYYADISCA